MTVSNWHLLGVAAPYVLIATALWGLGAGAIKDAVRVGVLPSRTRLGGLPTVPFAYALGFLAVAFIYGCALDRHHMGVALGVDPHAVAPGADLYLYALAVASWASALFLVGAYVWLRRGTRQILTTAAERGTIGREAEEQRVLLRTVMDAIPATVFATDRDGRFLLQNDSSTLGDGPGDIVGKTVYDLFPEEQASQYEAQDQAVMASGERQVVEHPLVTVEGNLRTYQTTKVPLRNVDGEAVGIVGISYDITEQKAIEAEIRTAREAAEEQRQALRALIDAIPDPIYLLDREGTYVTANRAGAEDVGLASPGEVTGKTAADLFPPQVAERVRAADLDVMASGEPVLNTEYALVMPDGEERTLASSRIPLRGPDGEVSGMVSVTRDVTEQKAVEAEIRKAREGAEEQRQMLQTIVDAIPDFVYAMDRDGRFTLRNRASVEPHGIADPTSVIGKTEFDLFPAELAEQYWADNRRVMESGEAIVDKEEPSHEEGGFVATTKVPLRGEGGEVVGLVGVSRDVTDRKRAEAALRAAKEAAESRERELAEQQRMLRTIIDTIPDRVYVIDREGRFVLRNEASVAGTGLASPEDAVGLTEFDLFPEAIAAKYHADNLRVMESEESLLNQEQEKVNGGWLSATKVPLRDEAGEVVGLVGVSRDITEQKETEAALLAAKEAAESRERELAEKQEMLRAIVDAIPDYIYAVDREGRFTLRNRAAAKSVGFDDPEAMVGLTEFDLFPAEHAEQYLASNLRIMEAGAPLLNAEEQGHDGSWLLTTKVPLRNAAGEVFGLVGTSRDITAQKEAQAEIRAAKEAAEARGREAEEQRQMLRTIVDAIPDFIYAMDRDGRFTLRNRASVEPHGVEDPTSLIGLTEFDLFPAELAEQYWADNRRVMESGEAVVDKEEPSHEEGGFVATTKVPLRGEGGEVVGLVGVSRDVTDRKRAEAALRAAKEAAEAATKAKSEFLANMSHEIRTPMNGVIGMTSLLLDTPLDAEQRDFVDTIRTSGDALLTIINDILDFSKIEAGMLALESHPFDVRRCVEEALDLIAPRAAEKGIELAYLVEDGVPHAILGDVTRVRQVLVNLLGNAVKFTAAGSVCVRVRSVPSDVETGGRTTLWFDVEDTGIGIPADKVGSIFEAFSQADASTTRQFGGTGLGLTISRRLVAMMGGEMGVESEVGVGSTFRFSVAAEVAPSERRVFLRPDQPALEGRRVLIVDDNKVNREILTRLSVRWRMTADEAVSGAQGLAAVERARAAGRPYDLVLLDMQMPEMDGIEVARRLQGQGSAPVVVMLTSINRDATLRDDAREAGVHTVLYKPTKPSQLYDVLIDVFGEEAPAGAEAPAWVVRPKASPGSREPEDTALRILLAEDNAVNQKVAVRLLNRLGHRADVVANGVEAVEAVRRQAAAGRPYDVVLMDVQMPEMDGLEATRQIRAAGREVPQPQVIALTANAMEGDRERCLDAGADDYLTKPVVVESVREALDRAAMAVAMAG